MVMKALRDGASGGFTKIILFGFLIMAVGGMVFMDIGGFFSGGGIRQTDVAKVGREKIAIAGFDRTVRRTLSRIGLPPQEAYKVGYINQILASEMRARLLAQLAEKNGVLISQQQVAAQIKALVAPMTAPEQSAKDVLQQILMNQGMGQAEFVEAISRDMAGSLISDAMEKGFAGVPEDMARDLYLYQNEKRDISYILYNDSEFSDLEEPPEEQLRTLYEAVKETAYAIPETRTFKLVTIRTDGLKKTLEISDEEVREAYEGNIDLYRTEEERMLEQAVVAKEEDAEKIANAAKSGKGLKATVKAVTGSESAYLGEKAADKDSLLDELKEPVLSAEKQGTVIGPVQSSLGWHVAVVKKITPAKTKSFDEVKKSIRDELLETRTIDQQYAMAGTVDDMLAAGATLDELSKDVDVSIRTLPPVNNFGLDKNGKDALKDLGESRDAILEAGANLEEGETSQVLELPDGKFTAVNLEVLQPKSYRPFEDVKGELKSRWMKDNRHAQNAVRVMQAMEEMKASGESISAFAQARKKSAQSLKGLSRDKEPKAPLNPRSLQQVFDSPVDTPFVITTENGSAIVSVTKAELPQESQLSKAEMKTFGTALAKSTKDEGLMTYLESKRQSAGIRVNQPLLDQVYGPGTPSN
jgi:peptidyl-prolyl cis-trans isomerase D